MITGLAITILLFVVAIALIIAANFAVRKYLQDSVPDWVQESIIIASIIVIMAILYHSVGHVWGVYELSRLH